MLRKLLLFILSKYKFFYFGKENNDNVYIIFDSIDNFIKIVDYTYLWPFQASYFTKLFRYCYFIFILEYLKRSFEVKLMKVIIITWILLFAISSFDFS